jgi:endonuclease-8
MPEGDTVHSHARRIREKMLGRRMTRVAGTEPTVRRRAAALRGASLERVEAVGKHLLLDFHGGWSARVHLGMTGRWRFGPPTGARSDGPARIVLETDGWSARCYGAPTVRLERTPRIWDEVEHLGPDLLDEPIDLDRVIARARAADQHRTVSDILLDQRIAAGVGNVYRNEVLFEAGLHPEATVATVDDDRIRWIYERAAGQLRRNIGRRARSTTGGRSPGTESFVYGRPGKPCRRCGTQIRIGASTDLQRVTYWCPTCQPE